MIDFNLTKIYNSVILLNLNNYDAERLRIERINCKKIKTVYYHLPSFSYYLHFGVAGLFPKRVDAIYLTSICELKFIKSILDNTQCQYLLQNNERYEVDKWLNLFN